MVAVSMMAGVLGYQLLRVLMIRKYAGVKVQYKLRKGYLQIGSEAYIGKRTYMVVIWAPIVIFTTLLLLIIVVSRAWFWGVYLPLIGIVNRFIRDDICKVIFLRNTPTNILIKDEGFIVTLYSTVNDKTYGYDVSVKRRLMVAALVFTLCLCAIVTIWNIVIGSDSRVPPWDTAEFRNENLISINNVQDTVTSGTLRLSLGNFNNLHVRNNYNLFAWIPPLIPSFHNDERLEMQDTFISAFTRGWDGDRLSQVMPFNSTYIRSVLEAMNIYFAPNNFTGLEPWGGFISINRVLNSNHMFIGLWDPRQWSAIEQPRISIHEVGHALGLMTLTDLFAREFMRPHVAWMDNVNKWDYDIYFDMTLISLTGQEAFWRAAFTSNNAYGELWDAHLGTIISFEDIMLARGVIRRIGNGNTRLLQAYRKYTGNYDHDLIFFEDISSRFFQIFGAAGEQHYDDELLTLLHDLSRIARARRISPVIAVSDNIIYGYEMRMPYAGVLALAISIASFSFYVFVRNVIIVIKKNKNTVI